MRYKQLLIFPAALALTLALTSCDQLFETNIFKQASLGQVTSASIAAMDAEEILASSGVLTSRPSESFFEAFAAAPEATRDAVVEMIRDYYNFPSDDPLWAAFKTSSKSLVKVAVEQTPAEREAGYLFLAASYLNLQIPATAAGTLPNAHRGLASGMGYTRSAVTKSLLDVLNGATSVLLGKSFSALTVSDAYSVLATLPLYIKNDSIAFKIMVDRFVLLDSVYDALADNPVHIPNGDSFVTVTDGALKGGIAQTAAAASIFAMIHPVAGTYSDGAGHSVTLAAGDRASALYAIVNNTAFIDGRLQNRSMLYPAPDTFGTDFETEVTSGKLSFLLAAADIDLASFHF